jgi:hypothetical protein
MQEDPQSIWPATAQPHVLFVQVAPAMHLFPHAPQLSESFVRFAQEPPAHCICPAGQLFAQLLPAHTWVPVQVIMQAPQLLLSGWMQLPLQKSAAPWHLHTPDTQVCPVAHAWLHPPQFWGSLPITFTQAAPHASIPLAQLVPPVAGFAQLATKRAHPRQATSADKRVLRASMVRLLKGGAPKLTNGRYPTAPGGVDRQVPIASLSVYFSGGAARI